MSVEPTVKFTIKQLERCVCASFIYGENSFESPYFTVYFIVNNSGIVIVYDKSVPTGSNEGREVYIDQLGHTAIEMKKGQNKYEVIEYIHEELGRIGEKLQKEGRALNESDISKLATKLSSRFGT
ncbi:hypothetical protein [Effusibacillus lacus]|uniref:Uncharacterized protein n=1 Tax=Effusibacillus lacus TaxID=1348429 RepID=A0A292YS49_9BACL|nr:hypothetical protein [Effusibacillus lacus]TCS76976.1 hypothetical protein EDD64_101200 [Effusibacillus lacus]GAX91305.1 hypothetical protein EFBL_2971 [Effusibacillus lacus]